MARIHARTNESGYAINGSLDFQNLIAQPLGDKRKSPWSVTIDRWELCQLSHLVVNEDGVIKGDSRYNILAQHVLSQGIEPDAAIHYGKDGSIKAIRIVGTNMEYRNQGYLIYEKRRDNV